MTIEIAGIRGTSNDILGIRTTEESYRLILGLFCRPRGPATILTDMVSSAIADGVFPVSDYSILLV